MMDDLISRQAAIDVLEERLRANGYSNVALISELNRSIGYLMQLPAAEPNRDGFLEFLFNVINPNEMEQYMAMYDSKGVAENGRADQQTGGD